MVATDLFGRGMDIERVNIVFNYDMPENSDTYLHRVRRENIVLCSTSSECEFKMSTLTPRWPELADSVPRVSLSHLYLMKVMLKS